MQHSVEATLVAYERARVLIEQHVAAYDRWRRYVTEAAVVTSPHDSGLLDHCGVVYSLEPLEPLVDALTLSMRTLVGTLDANEHVERMRDDHRALLARCREIRDDRSCAHVKPIHETVRTLTAGLHSFMSALADATPVSSAMRECDERRVVLSAHITACARQFDELVCVLWRCNWTQSVATFEQRVDVARAIRQQATALNRRISSHNDAHTRECAEAELRRACERVRLGGMVDAYAQWMSELRSELDALSIASDIAPTASSLRALLPQCPHQPATLHPFRIDAIAYVESECKKQLYYKQMMDGRRSVIQSIVHDVTAIEFTGTLWKLHSDLRLLEHRVRTIQWSTALHLESPSYHARLWDFYRRLMVELSRRLNDRLDCEYGGRLCAGVGVGVGGGDRMHGVADYKRALYTTVGQVVTMCQTMRKIDGVVLTGRQDRVLRDYQRRLDALHASESTFIQERLRECIRRHSDWTERLVEAERSHLEPIEASIRRLHAEKSDIEQSLQRVDRLTAECERAVSLSERRCVELDVLIDEMVQRGASPHELDAYRVEMATSSAHIRDMRVQISKNQVEHETLSRAMCGAEGLCTRLYAELQRTKHEVQTIRDRQVATQKQHDCLRRTQRGNDELFERITHRVSGALRCITLPRVVSPFETPLFASTSDDIDVSVTVENTAALTSVVVEVASMHVWRMVRGRWARDATTQARPSRIRHYHQSADGGMRTFRFPLRVGTTGSCRVECSVVARLHVKTDAGLTHVAHRQSVVQYRTDAPLSMLDGASVALLLVFLAATIARFRVQSP
jgi:hypothetical protein